MWHQLWDLDYPNYFSTSEVNSYLGAEETLDYSYKNAQKYFF
jgi:hypothetical protein